MTGTGAVHLRRGTAGPRHLTAALDRLEVEEGDDFVVMRADDYDDPDYGLGQSRIGPFRKETSRLAAVDNYPRAGSQRLRVLLAIARAADGRTSDEVQDELGLEPQSVTARVWELRKGGWLQNTERRRRTRLGSLATVVELTPKAWDEVEQREGIRRPGGLF